MGHARSVVALVAATCAFGILAGCTTSLPAEPPDEKPTESTTEPSADESEGLDRSAHPLGAKWVWAEFDKVKPFLAELGGGHTYVEVVLCNVQSAPGVWDWSVPDSQVSRARDIGFGSLVKLRTGRCWATPGFPKHLRGHGVTESAMPQDMAVYADFVDQAVRRYTELGVTEFAIENEVSSPYFWDGTPQEYATLARAAAEVIHAAAPAALVVDASVSSAATGYVVADGLISQGKEAEAVDFYQTYYERRFGTRSGDASIDAVSSPEELREELVRPGPVRAISYMRAIDELFAQGVFQVRQVHFYENWQALPMTLDYIRGNTPDDVPMEMWELGIWHDDRTIPEDQRTAEVVKATVIALGAGVQKVLWLPLLDNPNGRQGATLYGLVSPSGEPRGSLNSYMLLARAAADHAIVAPVASERVMGATFDSTSSTLVAWASMGEVPLPPISDATGTILDDQTLMSGTGDVPVTLGSQPVLMTTSGAVTAFDELLR